MGNLIRLMFALVATLPLTSLAAAAQATTVQARGGYFAPSDAGFKDVYGGGPQYGGQITRRVAGRWDGWIEARRQARSGELTFTHEPTSMSLLRILAGARYRFSDGRLVPYADAGLGLYRFSESNVIGDVSKGGLGALARVGALLKLGRRVHLSFDVGYSHCQMKPAESEVKLSGIEAGGGIALAF
jgi:hypothetical protein